MGIHKMLIPFFLSNEEFVRSRTVVENTCVRAQIVCQVLLKLAFLCFSCGNRLTAARAFKRKLVGVRGPRLGILSPCSDSSDSSDRRPGWTLLLKPFKTSLWS